MQIGAAVDHADFGVCVDIWNVWHNPDVVQEIEACADRIFVMHVSD